MGFHGTGDGSMSWSWLLSSGWTAYEQISSRITRRGRVPTQSHTLVTSVTPVTPRVFIFEDSAKMMNGTCPMFTFLADLFGSFVKSSYFCSITNARLVQTKETETWRQRRIDTSAC